MLPNQIYITVQHIQIKVICPGMHRVVWYCRRKHFYHYAKLPIKKKEKKRREAAFSSPRATLDYVTRLYETFR